MYRILFLNLFFFVVLCFTLAEKALGKESPNIILILTDDQRWDAMSCVGNPVVKTPEMDRLADEGTIFKKAFVTTPICAASRASILTGLYERTHGYTFGQGALRDSLLKLLYPVILMDNGYYTGFYGKLGVAIEHNSTLFDQMDVYDRDVGYADYRGYFYKTINGDTVHLTRYTGFQAQEFIRKAPKDKPFCLSLSFSAPHAHDPAPEQYFWQEKSNSRYACCKIPPPELGDECYFTALPQEVQRGFNRTRWHWRFDTSPKFQRNMKGYYRMISEIDDEIGELRNVLEEEKLAENTVIIFMGDNGYFEGERQLAGKWLMYDNSLRVPMIIYDPRVNCHYEVSDIVLNIDIPNTILELAGVNVPSLYQGKSLIPYISEGTDATGKREIALFEHLWELPEIPASEGVRTEEWKYFRYKYISAPEELYNVQNDPLEIQNLATDPAYEGILINFRLQCDSIIEKYSQDKVY